jgi:hypothetical protein
VTTTIDAVTRLDGQPIVAVRYSDSDGRRRHRGVSHHTRTALSLGVGSPWVPYPAGAPAPDLFPERNRVVPVDVPPLDADLTSMGRSQEDDPAFFTWSAAAGVLAAQLSA